MFSRVWRAVALGSGQVVALKQVVLGSTNSGRVEAVKALLRAKEAFVLAFVSHPHVVALRRVRRVVLPHAGRPVALVLEMPFIPHDLMWCLRTRQLDRAEDAVAVVRQLLRALAYLHSLGLAHRAVEPASVLVTLPDSGGGAVHATLASFRHVCTPHGSPELCAPQLDEPPRTCYSSPDVLACRAASGRVTAQQWLAQDVWAVAVLALELLLRTGPPFRRALLVQMAAQGFVTTPAQRDMFPVLRCMRPDGRFHGLAALVAEARQQQQVSGDVAELLERFVEQALVVDAAARVGAAEALEALLHEPARSFQSDHDLAVLPLDFRVLSAFVNNRVPQEEP